MRETYRDTFHVWSVYLPTFFGCFINGKIYGKLVGKYTSPMDAGWDMVLRKFFVNQF